MKKSAVKLHTPTEVGTVRWLMLVYVGALALGLLAQAGSDTRIESRDLLRGLLRIAGFCYLIWWLPSLDRNAWRVSVFACGLLALLGGVALLLCVFAEIPNDQALLVIVAKLAIPVYALSHAFVVLMREETRLHFV